MHTSRHRPAQRRGPPRVASFIDEDNRTYEAVLMPVSGETIFVSCENGRVLEHDVIHSLRGQTFAPLSANNNLVRHRVVLLPSQVGPPMEAHELQTRVRAFIHRYADLSEGFEEIAALYVLLSWVFDSFTELPYLRLKGDFGTGKSRCLMTIGSVCYKPMFASGASTVSPLFRIIDSIRGTLILDEADFRFSDERAELTKILNNGNAAGFPVLRSEASPSGEFNPTAFVVFGPKIIATRSAFDDRALESRCITEPMTGAPPRRDIPLSLPASFAQEATTLRDCLLRYRLEQRPDISLDVGDWLSDCEPRISQVYAPLVHLAGDAGARVRIVEIARAASRALVAVRSADVEAQILGIINEMWRGRERLAVKAIADRFAELCGSDFHRPITPKWIGAQLRNRLSLVPTKVQGVFELGPETWPRLRTLFARYGLEDKVDLGDVAP